MYKNPPIALAMAEGQTVPREQAKDAFRHFEDFYRDVFCELYRFGEIEDMVVCNNIGDHLLGNVYVKFAEEDQAEECRKALSGRLYNG